MKYIGWVKLFWLLCFAGRLLDDGCDHEMKFYELWWVILRRRPHKMGSYGMDWSLNESNLSSAPCSVVPIFAQKSHMWCEGMNFQTQQSINDCISLRLEQQRTEDQNGGKANFIMHVAWFWPYRRSKFMTLTILHPPNTQIARKNTLIFKIIKASFMFMAIVTG